MATQVLEYKIPVTDVVWRATCDRDTWSAEAPTEQAAQAAASLHNQQEHPG
jgi:hypothetical protein